MARPYDRLFKTLAEDDPRGLLHLFGSLPLDVEAEVRALEREVAAPALAVDHVYEVRTAEGEWLEHYEVQVWYKSDLPERLVRYGVSLALNTWLPVRTTLVLLVDRHAPRRVPSRGLVRKGSVEMVSRYRVVKLWEIDPAAALELDRPSLLPWVVLMRPSERAVRSAASRIARREDPKLAAEFVLLGGLRYDREDLRSMLGRLGAMLTDEIIRQSSFYQMILEEGIEKGIDKGIEKGIEKGTVAEARSNLKLVLSLRFPGLENRPELDSIEDRQRLEGLLAAVVKAADREAAEVAIRGVE